MKEDSKTTPLLLTLSAFPEREVLRLWECGRSRFGGTVALPSVNYQERKPELSRQTLDCFLAFLPCSELYRSLSGLMEPPGLLGKRMVLATWAQAGRQPIDIPLETKQDPVGPSSAQKPHHVPHFLSVAKGFSLLGLP